MGFEPTQLALVELESTPLDHSGKVSLLHDYVAHVSRGNRLTDAMSPSNPRGLVCLGKRRGKGKADHSSCGHASKGPWQKARGEVTAVGFEATQLALVELESTPLDHSGKLS